MSSTVLDIKAILSIYLISLNSKLPFEPVSKRNEKFIEIFKPSGWHQYTPTTSFRELCYWELLHEEGSFPISVFCESLGGGEVPLELVRAEENILAIFYFSETAAMHWEAKFRQRFEEAGWKVIEKARDGIFIPKAVGRVIPKEFPLLLVDAIEDSINWISPETIKTGNMADPTYSCPSN